MVRITRRLDFDYGHRVLGHESKCANVHGHRGVAEITVEAPDLDTLGRVVDFSVVKQRVGAWIDAEWDHNMLLHPEDRLNQERELAQPVESLEHAHKRLLGRKPYVMRHGNPTAENMARELFEVAGELLPDPLRVVRVRLYETPNCWADYEG